MAREFEFILADTEFYNPSQNPKFWYGGFTFLDTGELQVMSNFGIFWKKLFVEIPKDKQRIVVFHNAPYDMANLQAQAVQELGYRFNPLREVKDKDGKTVKVVSEKGLKKAIYQGQAWEVYANESENGVIVVDSLPLLRSSIASLGESFGLPKGETPIVEDWIVPNEEHIDYLKRDIAILHRAFIEYDLETAIRQGQFTISSIAQGHFKKLHRAEKGEKKHTGSVRHQFATSRAKKDGKALYPTDLQNALNGAKIELTDYIESKFQQATEESEYGIKTPLKLVDEYLKKVAQRGLKQYRKEHKGFNALRKRVHEPTCSPEWKQKYLALTVPDFELEYSLEEFEELIQDWLFKSTLMASNSMIRNGFRGGLIYLNGKIQGEILGAGFVVDTVSMYPSVMMKYDIPDTFEGTTEKIEPARSQYFVIEVTRLKATLKAGCHPCIKRNKKFFKTDDDYLPFLDWSAEREKKSSMLTSVDLSMLYANYDVEVLEYNQVHYYSASKEFNAAVKKHIAYWYEQKEKALKGSPEYVYAKNMLNNLWGRWAMYEKIVVQGGVEKDIGQKDVNLVSALFITAYARLELNQAMNFFGERLIYANTDSVHALLYKGETVDEVLALASQKIGNKLGLWDVETVFNRATYLGNNKYCHELPNKKLHTVVSGLELKEGQINRLEEFFEGKVLEHYESLPTQTGQIVIEKHKFKL